MAAGDEQLSLGNRVKASNKFFDRLTHEAKVIVEEESQKMANSMQYILYHRQQFKSVGGQFPRWDPSYLNPKQARPLSKKAFSKWRVKRHKDGEYWLYNDQKEEGGFSYVKSLLQGGPWRTEKAGGRLVAGPNGGLYSYQMPEGLAPWIGVKKEDLANNILKRFGKELKK